MLSFGFKIIDTQKKKARKVFCPSIDCFENPIWLWNLPDIAIQKKFKLKDNAFFIFEFNKKYKFWTRTTWDCIEPGGIYYVSYSTEYPNSDFYNFA